MKRFSISSVFDVHQETEIYIDPIINIRNKCYFKIYENNNYMMHYIRNRLGLRFYFDAIKNKYIFLS